VPRPARVLILSASIGEGHDLPARELARGLRDEAGAEVEVVDGLLMASRFLHGVATEGTPLDTPIGVRLYDLNYLLVTGFGVTRRLAGTLGTAIGGRALRRGIAAWRPDVVVSTYPGLTEMLGRLRRLNRMPVPLVSAITDLAALRWWAHPGIDLHLITHPESEAEVRAIAGPRTRIVAVKGLTAPGMLPPPDPAAARARLGLPADGRVVAVSGGGWAVGDLAGAIDEARAAGADAVVALCGRSEAVRARLAARHAGDPSVVVLGFTDDMAGVLSASDALVHSTAGLTVLEAIMCGCPVISYGWGRAHIRVNNEAYVRFGLAAVARDRTELRAALATALAERHAPDPSWAELPSAASAVLDLLVPDVARG
jgi:UDP-N-acetylglucosamine:LPS N-acetylglucosamine transferase